MIFGNRTVDDILLYEEINELAEDNPDFKIFFTVDI
jgi:NAD(P)H-flavin reductase